ncbi:MAG: hypothetical protein JXN64_10455 [Spirochaetes bacterium]|nr:hypothetical protein [Spirochaetota bacterium]
MPKKHTTHAYHRYGSPDLMTELTVCESLGSADSPYMVALENPKPYGAMMGDFLIQNKVLRPGSRIMETGGGYGTLMKGLLNAHSGLIAGVCMTDLSMYMLNRQREALKEWGSLVSFVNAEILSIVSAVKDIDLIILNEVIGDLDVLVDMETNNLTDEAAQIINKYNLESPSFGKFNFNIGAVRLIEAISKNNIPAFISEHSSDPLIPERMYFLEDGLDPDSFPREIRLHGHSEYTIRFSHIVKTAEALGRRVRTGALIDLVGIKDSPKMKFIFTNRACSTDRQEIIYEFLDHIREYRWMIIE